MTTFLNKKTSLTPDAKHIIADKYTERPFSGQYNQVLTKGSYLCRCCGLALFRADSQFDSGCGWPSFDVEIDNHVKTLLDPDGTRTEIRCNRCDAHLGHVFTGENLTAKNKRYCVNALSLDYVENNELLDTEEAILAGGCFWGVDYYLSQIPGVVKIEVGYTGGAQNYPSYAEVCEGNTGHYEAVRVVYDKVKTNYHTVVKRFFEIHDPTQIMGQGPDKGYQYQSAIFYYNDEQQDIANILMHQLKEKGYLVATMLKPVQIFWPAEEYHQHYYTNNGKTPYCHTPVLRFS